MNRLYESVGAGGCRPVSARRISIAGFLRANRRSPCCCATGCGDKIKHIDSDETCYEITWSDGSTSHLEDGCVEWFINGHPDYGYGYGSVPGLSSDPEPMTGMSGFCK